MDFSTINWLAVIAAAVSSFVLGGIWYSPLLFGKAWMTVNNLTVEAVQAGNKSKIFGLSFFLSLIMSVNLALLLNTADMTAAAGTAYGLLAGVWVFCGLATVALFELKGARYILINGGYCLTALGLMGAILGAWR